MARKKKAAAQSGQATANALLDRGSGCDVPAKGGLAIHTGQELHDICVAAIKDFTDGAR